METAIAFRVYGLELGGLSNQVNHWDDWVVM